MHVVEGERGIVVIDPLISAETAAAALALYREHRGERPVTGLVYTHCHIDHFGGAAGIVSPEEVAEREIPVLAPEGFLHHAVSENVYAGTAMGRRAGYMYGAKLRRGPDGGIGSGLGQTTSLGTLTLIPPNLEVTATGQEETVDGVRMVFQLTPGTEAPAEMNFHFPEHRVLCIAENATHTMHNVLTLRGALVRDPHVWAAYLDEAIELFGADSDVLFAGHHWPRWGRERIVDYLGKQRDLYAYLHDQTLRLINAGLTGRRSPSSWSCRPSWPTSGTAAATTARSATTSGRSTSATWAGSTATRPTSGSTRRSSRPGATSSSWAAPSGSSSRPASPSRRATTAGSPRSSTTSSSPSRRTRRREQLQADALEQLGYGAENATWRNFYLVGAEELRSGITGTPSDTRAPAILAQLSVAQILDGMKVRLNGPRAWGKRLTIGWQVTDPDERHLLTVENGVLRHRPCQGRRRAARRPWSSNARR